VFIILSMGIPPPRRKYRHTSVAAMVRKTMLR
jgi:hypothetical protein